MVTTRPSEAVAGCEVVATDTWVSMGQETHRPRVDLRAVRGHRRAVRAGAPDAIVLHCLPAYRGKEIAAEVIDGPRSAVWDEAENRRHVQKAVLVFLEAGVPRGDPGVGHRARRGFVDPVDDRRADG